ncbi:MAG: hypothetical protein RL376_1712 [Verrucomicrobiota bacterium]|jgi:phage FluMu gp28-like protein
MITPLDILLPYQRAVVNDAARFKLWLASRQIGKSFGLSAEAVRDAAARPGTMWVVLSAGERQALEFMEKAKQWAEAFELVSADYFEDRAHGEALIKSAEIRWGNGSRMIALPANPSTARGYSANLILDEFAFHDDPEAIWRGIYPSISNPLKGQFKLRIASTPNGKGNKFFDLWSKDNGYAKHRTTIHDAKAGGLNVDIEQLKAGLDDPEGWAQEFECEFLDGSNVLLPYELIALAESADATEFADPALFASRTNRRLICGIDFGRQNDPTVCWVLEQVGDVLVTREVLCLRGMDTPDQVALLRSRVAACQRTVLDYTGPGVGLGDYLAKEFGEWDPEKHLFGKVELATFTANFKREIFPRLRRAFEAPTRLRVPISRAVREDLHAMQQVVNNGQYNYWAPRTREGHSDRCTALALAVRAAGEGGGPFHYDRVERRGPARELASDPIAHSRGVLV